MTPVLAVIASVVLLRHERASDAVTLLLLGAGFLILTGMFTLPCRYTILNDALSIRCGILYYQVPLNEIERVEPSASLRSGPALSTRRVVVATKERSYLISPKERDQFLTEIKEAMSRTH